MAQIRMLTDVFGNDLESTIDREQRQGSGSPQGVVLGDVGDLYRDLATPALYLKQTGYGTTTGWGSIGGGGTLGLRITVPFAFDTPELLSGATEYTVTAYSGANTNIAHVTGDISAVVSPGCVVNFGANGIFMVNVVEVSGGETLLTLGDSSFTTLDFGTFTIRTGLVLIEADAGLRVISFRVAATAYWEAVATDPKADIGTFVMVPEKIADGGGTVPDGFIAALGDPVELCGYDHGYDPGDIAVRLVVTDGGGAADPDHDATEGEGVVELIVAPVA